MTRSVSKEYKWLCQFLIEARQRKGLTQAEVDDRLGLHQPFVSQYERGKHRLDIVELVRIAEVLDFDPHRVLANMISLRQRARSQNDESQEF